MLWKQQDGYDAFQKWLTFQILKGRTQATILSRYMQEYQSFFDSLIRGIYQHFRNGFHERLSTNNLANEAED